MRNTEYGMRSENPSTISDGPPPFRQGRLSADKKEVASVQVIFPNRKTADEIVSELWDEVEKMQKEIDALKELMK